MVQKPFDLSVLGGLRLFDFEGRLVEPVVAQGKRAAILTYLRLATVRGAEQREKILALFWPELNAEAARNSLNQAIHFLRRTLGADCVVTAPDQSIAIDPSTIRCDASEFERLLNEGRHAEALKLYAGPFLDGFHLHQVPQFNLWVEAERERLQSRFLKSVECLARIADSKGDKESAVDLWKRAATAAPLDTRYAVGFSRALSNAGRRADAIRHLEVHRRLFKAELDAQPDGELTVLENELRSCPNVQYPSEPPARIESDARSDQVDSAPESTERLPSRNFSKIESGAVAGLVLLLSLTGFLRATTHGKSPALPKERILVAALANKTGDSALNEVGGLAADYVSDGLLRTGVVQVVDPGTAYYAVRTKRGASLDLSLPDTRLEVARSVHAGTLVWGAIYKAADSLMYEARATDMASGDLIGVVRVSTRLTAAPTVAVKELEQRLGGLIATRLDVNLNSLGASHLPPPSLDAYREYSRGLQYFRRDEYDDALRAFINARRADSTFFLPLVWAWYAAGNAYHFRMQDSLIAASRKLRDRLSPLDRYAFDAHASTNAEEERVATAAAARIAPGSNWSFMLGSIELSHLHAKAAIKALSTVDRAHGWARGWSGVDLTLMAALHLVGDYAAELAIADEAIARADTDGINTSRQGLEAGRVRALAGIGDTAALHAGIARLISISGRDASDIWEIEDTDMTLLYHGWRREADAVAKYAQREARKLAEKDDLRPERALVAEQAYLRWDLPVARSLAERSLAIDSLQRTFSDPDVSRILAVIAAIENRPAAVERQIAFARMATQDSGYPSYISARDSARQVIWNKHNRHLQGPTYTQACVAAVRGDAVTAANRLRDAIEKGMARPFAVLMDPCFRPIRKSQEYRALFAE